MAKKTKLTKSKYKLKYCDVCKNSYGINYYYDHKNTGLHKRNVNAIKVKEELLNEDANENQENDKDEENEGEEIEQNDVSMSDKIDKMMIMLEEMKKSLNKI